MVPSTWAPLFSPPHIIYPAPGYLVGMKYLFQRLSPLLVLCAVALLLVVAWRVRPGAGAEPTVSVRVLTPRVPQGGSVFLRIDAPEAKSVSAIDQPLDGRARRDAGHLPLGWQAAASGGDPG